MIKRRLFLVSLVAVVFICGCIFGDNDDDDIKIGKVNNINQLTMGGGVFILREEGYGFTQIGTFNEIYPYEEATVFVNGIELANEGGFHTNTEPLSIESLTSGPSLRIVVYALGDSVVSELTIPEDPVIVKPEENAVVHTGESLLVEINFPGDHQYIAMTMTQQENIAAGFETSEQKMMVEISGEKLPNAGTSLISAYAVNISSKKIPNNFNMNKQYEIFLVASVVIRAIEFIEPE